MKGVCNSDLKPSAARGINDPLSADFRDRDIYAVCGKQIRIVRRRFVIRGRMYLRGPHPVSSGGDQGIPDLQGVSVRKLLPFGFAPGISVLFVPFQSAVNAEPKAVPLSACRQRALQHAAVNARWDRHTDRVIGQLGIVPHRGHGGIHLPDAPGVLIDQQLIGPHHKL